MEVVLSLEEAGGLQQQRSVLSISLQVLFSSILLEIILNAAYAKCWRKEGILTSFMTATTQTGPLDVPGS